MDLPKQVITALALLNQGGYSAHCVGGCVRDFLMGKTPKDMDIATSARPQEMKQIFSNCHVIETGISHGTLTVIMDSLPMEITTYRIDGEYADHRRPNSVTFTEDLCADLSRRDFTINAMAYHPELGLSDPFGGQKDIQNKIIRCVGQGDVRFEEDALRIMRALRFSSTLGFSIEGNTAQAMDNQKHLLDKISVERIAAELSKLLMGQNVLQVLTECAPILCTAVLPELAPMVGFEQKSKYHLYDVYDHTARVVEAVADKPHLKLAALLHDTGKPYTFSVDKKGYGHFYGHAQVSIEITQKILNRLKFDNATKEKVCTLVEYHDVQIGRNERSVRKWLNRLTPDIFFDLLLLKRADNLAQNPAFSRQQEINTLEALAEKIIKERQCFSMDSLAIGGSDLLTLGLKEGRQIGEIKNTLLKLVIEGKLQNDREVLLTYAKKILYP